MINQTGLTQRSFFYQSWSIHWNIFPDSSPALVWHWALSELDHGKCGPGPGGVWPPEPHAEVALHPLQPRGPALHRPGALRLTAHSDQIVNYKWLVIVKSDQKWWRHSNCDPSIPQWSLICVTMNNLLCKVERGERRTEAGRERERERSSVPSRGSSGVTLASCGLAQRKWKSWNSRIYFCNLLITSSSREFMC